MKQADTTGLPQFPEEVEFQPRPGGYRVAFSLEDASLAELVRVISQLTGRRFIFGGKVRDIKATVYSPQKVTVAEAYKAFLSILETNGLTVVPQGRFLKIIETPGVVSNTTPIYGVGQPVPAEDRYVTRLYRLQHVDADEVGKLLAKFKSKEADVTVYAPGNLLIITDTASNIRRHMRLIEEVDVGGASDQIWVEKITTRSRRSLRRRSTTSSTSREAARAAVRLRLEQRRAEARAEAATRASPRWSPRNAPTPWSSWPPSGPTCASSR